MAYDEDRADLSRELLADEPDLIEKRVLSGLAFLVAGNMAVKASGQGGLLARADPEEGETLMRSDGVAPTETRGFETLGEAARTAAMAGWFLSSRRRSAPRPSSSPGSAAASPTPARSR